METKNFSTRRFILIVSAVLSGLSILEFLIYYIFYGFLYSNGALVVTASYFISFTEGLFPILAATAVFFFFDSKKTGGKALIALLLSVPKILYLFPRYYLYFVAGVFNSIEAITLSILVSVLYVLYTFLQIFICIFILNLVIHHSKHEKKLLETKRIFSLDDSTNFALAMTSVFIFVIFLVKECFNTVSYFLEVGGGYTGEEIITIVISFLLLPLYSFIYYLICVPLKNKILCKNEKADDLELQE